jgi:hypothetical protein
MTSPQPYTPDVVQRTIAKNAGRVPPQQIADALGWPLPRLERVAHRHEIDLRLFSRRESDRAGTPTYAVRVSLADRRSEHFGVKLRPADAAILRVKAGERFTNPSDILARVFEGAVARGKVDELITAAAGYGTK